MFTGVGPGIGALVPVWSLVVVARELRTGLAGLWPWPAAFENCDDADDGIGDRLCTGENIGALVVEAAPPRGRISRVVRRLDMRKRIPRTAAIVLMTRVERWR